MLALTPPVDAPIVRPFHYLGSPFARGLHRGVDLGAPPGAHVAAPCGGRVAFAGARAVTLLCRGRRVTLLPLRAVTVQPGEQIDAGAPLARVGRDPRGAHSGLHLGVRRAGERFGYVDPAPLLRAAEAPVLGPAPSRVRPGRRAPRGRFAVRAAPVAAAPSPTAPWPAWLGAAGVALAAAGSAQLRIRARRRAPRAAVRPSTQG